MKDSIKYLRFNPREQLELLPQVVSCYRDVFADAPWNEWKRCTQCNLYWGISDQLQLEAGRYKHCGQPLIDYWPTEIVTYDITHEVTIEASCWLALDGEKVVGFCWGYPVGLSELFKKLKLPVLPEVINRLYPNVARIAYHDEIGVLSEYRRQGIAKKLFNARLVDFISQGLRVGVVRTKTNPPTVVYQWYRQIGYQVIAEYNDPEGRVVMARSITDLSL